MAERVHHVEPRARGWATRPAGGQQADRLFSSKPEAERWARQRARREGGEVVVHDREGDVEARWRP
jgi:hypothetical protein